MTVVYFANSICDQRLHPMAVFNNRLTCDLVNVNVNKFKLRKTHNSRLTVSKDRYKAHMQLY